jgi:hypothetical protein
LPSPSSTVNEHNSTSIRPGRGVLQPAGLDLLEHAA